jgi:hypothetical protein
MEDTQVSDTQPHEHLSLVPEFDSEVALLVAPEFRITDKDSAEWVVRKIAEERAHIQRTREWADKEIDRATREEAWLLRRFGAELEFWASKNLPKKRKSLDLPSGTVGFRKQPARLVVDDEPKAMEWARAHAPAAVVVVPATERLSKSALSDECKRTGEIPDGARWQDERDSFYVK